MNNQLITPSISKTIEYLANAYFVVMAHKIQIDDVFQRRPIIKSIIGIQREIK